VICLWSFPHPKSSGLRNGRTESEFRHKTLKIDSLHIFNKSFPRWWNSMHVWKRRMTLPILFYPIQAALYGTCLCCPLCHSSMPKRSKWLDHAKFCAKRSRRCGDMAVFRFSRWRLSAIFDFYKLEILTAHTLRGPECVILPKSCADRSNRCGDMAVFNFSRWRPSAILDLLYSCLDHPRSVFWWTLSLCKIWFESVQ